MPTKKSAVGALLDKGTVIRPSDLADYIKSPRSVTVFAPIPSLVRERDGGIEYLLIGQKVWRAIPDAVIKEIRIAQVEPFPDSEPLVVVHLSFREPATDMEMLGIPFQPCRQAGYGCW